MSEKMSEERKRSLTETIWQPIKNYGKVIKDYKVQINYVTIILSRIPFGFEVLHLSKENIGGRIRVHFLSKLISVQKNL